MNDDNTFWIFLLIIIVIIILEYTYPLNEHFFASPPKWKDIGYRCVPGNIIAKYNDYIDSSGLQLRQLQCLGTTMNATKCATFPGGRNIWACSKQITDSNQYQLEPAKTVSPYSNSSDTSNILTCDGSDTPGCNDLYKVMAPPTSFSKMGFSCDLGTGVIPTKVYEDKIQYLTKNTGSPIIFPSKEKCMEMIQKGTANLSFTNCPNGKVGENCKIVYDSLGLKTFAELGYSCFSVPTSKYNFIGKKGNDMMQVASYDGYSKISCDEINFAPKRELYPFMCNSANTDDLCKEIYDAHFTREIPPPPAQPEKIPTYNEIMPNLKCNVGNGLVAVVDDENKNRYLADSNRNPIVFKSKEDCEAELKKAPLDGKVTVLYCKDANCEELYKILGIQPTLPVTVPDANSNPPPSTNPLNPSTNPSNTPPSTIPPNTSPTNPPPTVNTTDKLSCCKRKSPETKIDIQCADNLFSGTKDCDDFISGYCAKKLTEFQSTSTNKKFGEINPECACYAPNNQPGFPPNAPNKCYMPGCGAEGSYMDSYSRGNSCDLINCSSIINFNKLTGGTDTDQTLHACADWLPIINKSDTSNSPNASNNSTTEANTTKTNNNSSAPNTNNSTTPSSAPQMDTSTSTSSAATETSSTAYILTITFIVICILLMLLLSAYYMFK